MGESRSGFSGTWLDNHLRDTEYKRDLLGLHYISLVGRIMNIMLINWLSEDRAERVALGYVHEKAWDISHTRLQQVVLE